MQELVVPRWDADGNCIVQSDGRRVLLSTANQPEAGHYQIRGKRTFLGVTSAFLAAAIDPDMEVICWVSVEELLAKFECTSGAPCGVSTIDTAA